MTQPQIYTVFADFTHAEVRRPSRFFRIIVATHHAIKPFRHLLRFVTAAEERGIRRRSHPLRITEPRAVHVEQLAIRIPEDAVILETQTVGDITSHTPPPTGTMTFRTANTALPIQLADHHTSLSAHYGAISATQTV